MYDLSTVQRGMFWLWLAVSGNFISETLGCKTQQFLNDNMYAKQIVTFAILYFVTGFIDTTKTNPLEHFKLSGIIWVIFLLFSKMHLVPTIIAFALVCISYVLNDYSRYYKESGDIEKSETYKTYSDWVLKANISLIVVSFIVYFIAKYKEYKGNFNFLKFILGKPSCRGN